MRTRFFFVTFTTWMMVVAASIYVYFARADIVRDEILVLSSASAAIVAAVYLVMGCIRGFTLIPVTFLIPLWLPFLEPSISC